METRMTPQFNTILFSDAFESAEEFANEYKDSELHNAEMDDSLVILFYLLYGRYANSPIANYDVNQWKYKVYAVIWQYGPTWVKRVDLQKKLRNLSDAEILTGSKTIHNSALNPQTSPTTSTLEELNYINQQNTSNYKKAKMDAYMQLESFLEKDVTEDFINKFKPLFKIIVRPENPLLYITGDEDEIQESGPSFNI